MTRLLYNLLFPFALLAILPRYLGRMMRRGNFRRNFGQRFARYSPQLRDTFSRGPWVWVHAVSVGELLVALKVIRALHRKQPHLRFVVSSTTSTAHSLAESQREDWWVPVYTPIDFSPFVRRAFDAVKPVAVVLTESEMWPNFIWTAARRGIPLVLVNARVSPRSERRYRRFAPFLRSVARHLHGVGLQEPAHAGLWEHLGVGRDRLRVTGSVKFDPVENDLPPRDFRPVLQAFGFDTADPILLAGSTHDGEEEILGQALRLLRAQFPATRLLIAPRHVERSADIASRLAAQGWKVAMRNAPPGDGVSDILVINTTGELRDWYACADIVFIGKSLAGRGGQNPVEAILAGRPVLFGPHMENFAALQNALLEIDGAVEIHDAASLAEAATALLSDRDRRTDVAARALQALDPHRGATARTVAMIEEAALMGSDSGREPA